MRSVTDNGFHIMTALAQHRLHGYGIITAVLDLSSSDKRMSTGTLYSTLDRLVDSDLVCSDGEQEVDGRTRRFYILTAKGRDVAATEAERRRRVAGLALRWLQANTGNGVS